MMDNMSCKDNQHQYGLWSIDDNNMACRCCEKCGYIEKFVATEEFHQQVAKQKEAKLFLDAFQLVSNDDEHIIGYLNVILDDYLNYLGKDALNLLITRMEILGKDDKLDIQNAVYINYLLQYLRLNNFESFRDTLDQFQEYNAAYFARIMTNMDEKNLRHF